MNKTIQETAKDIAYEVNNVKADEISIVKIRTNTVEEWHSVVEAVKELHTFKNVVYVHVPIDNNGNALEPTMEFVK